MAHCNHQGWVQHFPSQGPHFVPGGQFGGQHGGQCGGQFGGQHGGPCGGQFGGQCGMMKPPAFMNMNPPSFAPNFPEPCGMVCNMQGGMPFAGMPCGPTAPTPCDVKCNEPCDAEKMAAPCNAPNEAQPCSMKSSPPQPERYSPFRPPCPTRPAGSGCPSPSDPKMGTSHGFPASSLSFPPRKMYQYTTSKTYKSCYAK